MFVCFISTLTEVYIYFQECDTGLYICMKTFVGLGEKFVNKYFEKTGNAVFLHMRRIKKEVGSISHV